MIEIGKKGGAVFLAANQEFANVKIVLKCGVSLHLPGGGGNL